MTKQNRHKAVLIEEQPKMDKRLVEEQRNVGRHTSCKYQRLLQR